MKINIGKLALTIGRLAAAVAKNPASAVATATTIALAVNQVVDGVTTIRRTVSRPKQEEQ